MNRLTHPSRRLAVVLAIAGMTAPAVASASSDTTPTTDAATSTSTTEPLVVEGDPACTPYVGVTQAFSSEAPDPDAVSALLDELEGAIPEDLEEHIPVMTEAARSVLASEGADFSAFETPEFTAAQSAVDPWMFDNCDFDQEVKVSTIDYGFEGLPEELKSGTTAILLTNEGSEMHEIVMLRRSEGTTESWMELLELPEEEAMEKATFVAGGFVPMNGSTTLVVASLEPGDYAALCFVSKGSTMAEGEMTEGTGPPHFVEGMVHEFTVTEEAAGDATGDTAGTTTATTTD